MSSKGGKKRETGKNNEKKTQSLGGNRSIICSCTHKDLNDLSLSFTFLHLPEIAFASGLSLFMLLPCYLTYNTLPFVNAPGKYSDTQCVIICILGFVKIKEGTAASKQL